MGLTVKQLAAAIEKNGGNVTEAARALKITRWALQKRIAKNKELQQTVESARESMVDLAEGKLKEELGKNNTAIIIFTLKTLGKKRGYVERQEVTGADGAPLVVKGYVEVTPDDWDDEPNADKADGDL